MTIDKEIRAEILRLYYAEKWKIGTIARQLGVHHITVDRVLADAGVPRQDRRRRSSKLDPFMPFIRHTLAVYPTLTASRLYDMVYERGYRRVAARTKHVYPGRGVDQDQRLSPDGARPGAPPA